MDRTPFKIMSANLLISYYTGEINRIKVIFQIHCDHQKALRNKLKEVNLPFSRKQSIEHKIHRNKQIINGLANYIIELRSDMKSVQRRHPLNMKKK